MVELVIPSPPYGRRCSTSPPRISSTTYRTSAGGTVLFADESYRFIFFSALKIFRRELQGLCKTTRALQQLMQEISLLL